MIIQKKEKLLMYYNPLVKGRPFLVTYGLKRYMYSMEEIKDLGEKYITAANKAILTLKAVEIK
jgi:hypothetical protein